MTALIDSSAWIEYFTASKKGQPLHSLLSGNEPLLVSSLNLFEIYYKFLKYSREEAEEKRVFISTRAEVIPPDKEIVVQAAHLKLNRHLSLADSIIWATAEKHNARLVTADLDFKGYKNLELLR